MWAGSGTTDAVQIFKSSIGAITRQRRRGWLCLADPTRKAGLPRVLQEAQDSGDQASRGGAAEKPGTGLRREPEGARARLHRVVCSPGPAGSTGQRAEDGLWTEPHNSDRWARAGARGWPAARGPHLAALPGRRSPAPSARGAPDARRAGRSAYRGRAGPNGRPLCACVVGRGSEAVASAPFPAEAAAELGGGGGGRSERAFGAAAGGNPRGPRWNGGWPRPRLAARSAG
ncbi:PREDICTED: collagen alpha-2(I) chain-like [Chinchilla lanigera]|uniref:collagen alpha-2(I) chain-like n=1 Tax=Chinchilla lanigera TaxID=34839 RepID=UPI0006972438|nr:PREDICTED: collagen alpha-2(I) chain-like [Chinchilla lanigera]